MEGAGLGWGGSMLDFVVVLVQVLCGLALACGLGLTFVHRREAAGSATDFDPMSSRDAGFRMRIVKEDAGVAELRKARAEETATRA
jgi:hypothetical protein